MAEFTPIKTQEEFDALISDRIQRAQNTVRKEYADYEEIKNQLKAANESGENLKQENGNLQNQIKELQRKLSKSETDSAKTRIALEEGLPMEMCSRLQGETEEEMRADAKGLAGLFQKMNVPPMFKPERNGEDTKTAAMKSLMAQLIRE